MIKSEKNGQGQAQIQWEGSNVLLAKHFDAGPATILPILKAFIAEFYAIRGDSPAAAPAQLLLWLGRRTSIQEAATPRQDKFSGWGLGTLVYPNLAYAYLVLRRGEIVVKTPRGEKQIKDMETEFVVLGALLVPQP